MLKVPSGLMMVEVVLPSPEAPKIATIVAIFFYSFLNDLFANILLAKARSNEIKKLGLNIKVLTHY
jgi:hypothetical protein